MLQGSMEQLEPEKHNNKGKITCYLVLLPEKNTKPASELEGGAFSVLPGCPMTMATRTTIQTFWTHRKS